MQAFLEQLVVASERRLRLASAKAEASRGDRDVHRLMMQSVFALEDTHFLLRQIAEQHGGRAIATAPAAMTDEQRPA